MGRRTRERAKGGGIAISLRTKSGDSSGLGTRGTLVGTPVTFRNGVGLASCCALCPPGTEAVGHRARLTVVAIQRRRAGAESTHRVGAPSGDDALSRRKPGFGTRLKALHREMRRSEEWMMGLDSGSDAIRCAHQHPTAGPWLVPLARHNRPRRVLLSAANRTDHLRRSRPTMPCGGHLFHGKGW